jgi:putative ABC transport system ATP-binding protein
LKEVGKILERFVIYNKDSRKIRLSLYFGGHDVMSVLKTTNLKKHYGESATVKAIDGVDFTVESGEFVSIVGSSGSGKSTLLHLLGGLDRPTDGTVEINGKQIYSMKDDELTIFRRRNIGFVFQSYNLVPVLNVEENILLPIQLDGNKPDMAFVDRVIETLGISEKRTSMPNQLSGGQQQRVAIARALASKPVNVLADEPTGNLDSKSGMDVMGLLKVSGEKFGQTIVLITHNPEIAQMADRTVRIEDGRIVSGTSGAGGAGR